MYILGAIMYI